MLCKKCKSWVCLTDNSNQLYILRLSKVWSMLHHGPAGRVQNKASCIHIFFWIFFSFINYKICVFIIVSSLFDEVSNFSIRILTNQKQKLVIRTCQWNYMTNHIIENLFDGGFLNWRYTWKWGITQRSFSFLGQRYQPIVHIGRVIILSLFWYALWKSGRHFPYISDVFYYQWLNIWP